MIEALKESFPVPEKDPSIAHFHEDKYEGSFPPVFMKFLDDNKEALKLLETSNLKECIHNLMTRKDDFELDSIKKAALLCTRAMKYGCVKRMEDIIDEDQPVGLNVFSKEIAAKIREPKKLRSKLPAELCDTWKAPVVSSGANSSSNATTGSKKLSFDCINFEVSVKYKDCVALMARTFIVSPTKKQEKVYMLLAKAFKEFCRLLRPGSVVKDVVDQVKALIKTDTTKINEEMGTDFDLSSCLNSDMGYSVGMVADTFTLNLENTNKVSANQALCVRLSMTDVLDKKSQDKPFSCLICDTLFIRKDKLPDANAYSETVTKHSFNFSDIIYEINDSDSNSDTNSNKSVKTEKVKKKPSKPLNKDEQLARNLQQSQGRVLRSQNKTAEEIEQEKNTASLLRQIDVHQRDLMQKRAEYELNKYHTGNEELETHASQLELKRKFPSASKYPKLLDRSKVYCDMDSECVFLPIFGYHVPFHITTIKSVNKNDEERATLLRLNFFYPTGGALSRDVSEEMRAVIDRYPKMAYLKEMSFKSRETDSANLNLQLRLIKELQKKVRMRKKKKEQEKDIIQQDRLILNTTSGRKPRIVDVSMRPPLRKGKCFGNLTAHINGLRFRTSRGETFDILYSNIKHFIFQPNDHELTVLVHFYLHHPVIIGSKTKTRDVQFYAEVVEGSTALDASNRRRNVYDIDEVDEEDRERKLRKRLNKIFKGFCDQVVETVDKNNQTPLEYDIPYRKLGFNGVPHKEMVLMQPTVNCLVNLTETPFFLVSLDEIEHIHFERTDFRVSKTFDMVLILKKHVNLQKPSLDVPQRIQSIPVEKFEMIKQWIHEKEELTFTNGTTPLNWKNVMVGVREELENRVFWADVDHDGESKPIGWNFLSAEDDEEVEGDDDDDGDSAFPDSVAEDTAESEEDSWDEEASDEEDDTEADESEDEEAPSWDQLHREAEASDRRKLRDEVHGDSGHQRKRRRR